VNLPCLAGGGLLAPLLAQLADATQVAPVALLTQAIRQAFFGLILGLVYLANPVLPARHGPNRALTPSSILSSLLTALRWHDYHLAWIPVQAFDAMGSNNDRFPKLQTNALVGRGELRL
jgi:hypothetical protein